MCHGYAACQGMPVAVLHTAESSGYVHVVPLCAACAGLARARRSGLVVDGEPGQVELAELQLAIERHFDPQRPS